tara:strand:+ start:114 stop:602 length:489 start_codon:yes stop_codon:yes gene_type:complete
MIKKFTEQDMQNYADYAAKAVLSNIQPDLAHWYAEWHKPTKKVIDLSVLIDSQIDCEFSDKGAKNWHVSKACKGIFQESLYGTKSGDFFEQCRPRMNHIHAWPEGECPLPEGFEVKVWFRSGGHTVVTTRSGNYWGINGDTMCFEVLGLADGYVMPWEQDNE